MLWCIHLVVMFIISILITFIPRTLESSIIPEYSKTYTLKCLASIITEAMFKMLKMNKSSQKVNWTALLWMSLQNSECVNTPEANYREKEHCRIQLQYRKLGLASTRKWTFQKGFYFLSLCMNNLFWQFLVVFWGFFMHF